MRSSRVVISVLMMVVVVCAASFRAEATEPPRLAVLELLNPAALDLQAVECLTDVLRAEASAAAGSRVQVITNESVLAI